MATKPVTNAATPGIAVSADAPFFTPQRTRLLAIAGGAVAVLAVAIWFFVTLGQRKESAASEQLARARNTAEQGDLGGAASQFEQIVTGFRGTQAAYNASIGLAQVKLIAEQNEGAVTTLTTFLNENPPAEYAGPANGLLGTAYENTGKFAEAVASYRKAADLATVPYLKVSALLDAARASNAAGKKDEAIAILKEILAKYKDVAGVVEAELMLGELTGGQTTG